MLRTAKTDTQLTVAPLLLDYLRQLRIKLTVAAFFSRQTPSTFFEQNSPTLTVSLFDFAFSRGLFITAAFGQPDILSPAAVLTAVAVSGCSLLTKFRLTGESTDIHPVQRRNILTCCGQCRQLRNGFGKIITLPALSLIAFAIETEDVSPQTITFPDVFDSQEYVAYSCRQAPSSE